MNTLELIAQDGHPVRPIIIAGMGDDIPPVPWPRQRIGERLRQRLCIPEGHDTTRVRRGLEETQWWPRERLDALRLERLRGLLGHAYRYVPYYKDVLDRAGQVGGAVTSLDDLQRLPLLTKSLIRSHSERLTSKHALQLASFNTGR